MVQLTYEEMKCIRGGYVLTVSTFDLLTVTTSPLTTVTTIVDTSIAASGDKRTPRPGSGGVSA